MGGCMYFFVSSDGEINAYTPNKEFAKLYKKQRKKKYIKISDKKLKKMNPLSLDQQAEISIYYDVAITEDEYDYFCSAWDQYIIESATDMEEFLSDLMVYKFTDKEKEKLKPLVKVLTTYRYQKQHGIIDECEDIDYYYNTHNALLYFIRNVL